MGTSNLNYYNDRYRGSLSESKCQILEQYLQMKEMGGIAHELLHVIYNLDDEVVEKLVKDYKKHGKITMDYERPVGSLRPYQTIGVGYLYHAESCILGDSVGMGKTVEVSGLLNLLSLYGEKELGHPHRYLLCTEKKLVTQVHKELIKFTGDYVYSLPSATGKAIDEFMEKNPYQDDLAYSLIGTHGLLKTDSFISWIVRYVQYHQRSPFDTLVVDESSVLGGNSSQIVESFKVLRRYFTRVYFLNATPLETGLGVLYNQLNLLDNTFMPTRQAFQKEYCIMDYSGMFPRQTNKYKNVEKFRTAVAYKYFASTRKENDAVMEGCHGDIMLSPLSEAQKVLMKESLLLQMVYDCPSYINENIPFDEEHVPKLHSLKMLLDGEYKEAESIIIYVHFKEAQAHIKEWCDSQGYSTRVLNGETPQKEVDPIIDGFKNGEYRILITNVQKGLNFGNCDYCIFYSIISNPSQMVQFEGRMTRSFDIYNKHVYMLCSEGREYKTLCSTVKDRAEVMKNVTNADYSVVLNILSQLKTRIGGN